MGTWGTGPFDNDSAADFAADVQGCTSAQARHDLLLATLRAGVDVLPKAELTNEYAWGYELEFAVAAAAFTADEYTGRRQFTDNSYARGVDEESDDLKPFVDIDLSEDLLAAARRFIARMIVRMGACQIDGDWVDPVIDIGFAMAGPGKSG